MGLAVASCCRKKTPAEVKQLLHEQEVTGIQNVAAKPAENRLANEICQAESFILRSFITNSEIVKLCDMFFQERQLYQPQS